MYGFSQPKSGAPDKYQESSLNEKIITGQWITKEIRATMNASECQRFVIAGRAIY